MTMGPSQEAGSADQVREQTGRRVRSAWGRRPAVLRRCLASESCTTSLASFHRRDTVDAFVARHREPPPLPVPDRNLVLVRVGNGRVRFGATQQHQLDRLADGWRMSPKWRALLRGVVAAGGRPAGFVVTLGGFVVAGAEITGAEWSGHAITEHAVSPLMTRFDLRPPGPWFDEWRGRHLPTSPGGAALRVWPLGWRAPWERTPRDRPSRGRSLG